MARGHRRERIRLEDAPLIDDHQRETLQQRYGGDVAVITGSMTNEYDYYGFQNMLVRGAAASGAAARLTAGA